MKIIIDVEDGIYAVEAESVEVVRTTLKNTINKIINECGTHYPYHFDFIGIKEFIFYDFVETTEIENEYRLREDINILELNDWFDFYKKGVIELQKEKYGD